MDKKFTIYRNELPWGSVRALSHLDAVRYATGELQSKFPGRLPGKGRFFDGANDYIVIELPTDNDDFGCWFMDGNRSVSFMTQNELEGLPEFVMDTLNIGCLAVERGFMLSPTIRQLFEEGCKNVD